MTDRLAHLHTESPAAFNELGNVPLTLAVAPRFLEKLQRQSDLTLTEDITKHFIELFQVFFVVVFFNTNVNSILFRGWCTCHLQLTSIKLANKPRFRFEPSH